MMDSLIILVDPDTLGQHFDLIIAKLVEPSHNKSLFEVDILSRYTKLQPDQVFNRIEGLVKTPLTTLANKLDATLKSNRKKGPQVYGI